MRARLPQSLDQILRQPTWPGTLERPPRVRNIGVNYDTDWARTPAARATRRVLRTGVIGPLTRLVTSPVVYGAEHLAALRGPVIFAANHTSHLDTAIVLTALPAAYRDDTVVAAAADYFYDRTWKAATSSLVLGTIPVERARVNRKSVDIAAGLIEEGYSLVIFPEGGRSPDGWGQEFTGGAAYLAKRCAVPVVPVHLRGVRPIFPKGSGGIRRGTVEVRFGDPLRPAEATATRPRGEDARRFAARVEAAVAVLADEAETDWWTARRNAAEGRTPDLRGPEVSPWRRSWTLPESARRRRASTRSSAAPW